MFPQRRFLLFLFLAIIISGAVALVHPSTPTVGAFMLIMISHAVLSQTYIKAFHDHLRRTGLTYRNEQLYLADTDDEVHYLDIHEVKRFRAPTHSFRRTVLPPQDD